MPDLVVVHGTWGRAEPWHKEGSPLRTMAAARGIHVWDFLWSGVLAGLPTGLPGDPAEAADGADDGKLLPWLDAGEKLLMALDLMRLRQPVNVLSHSHGLQVVTFAAIKGALFDTAISVSGPVRNDMQRARRAAKNNIRRWVQFADPSGTDLVIVDGELFDGRPGAEFDLPEGETFHTYRTGHSGALTDPLWLDPMLKMLSNT